MSEIFNLFNTLMLRKRLRFIKLSFAFLSVINEVMVAEKATLWVFSAISCLHGIF